MILLWLQQEFVILNIKRKIQLRFFNPLLYNESMNENKYALLKRRIKFGIIYSVVFAIVILVLELLKIPYEIFLYVYIVIIALIILSGSPSGSNAKSAFRMGKNFGYGEVQPISVSDDELHSVSKEATLSEFLVSLYLFIPPIICLLIKGF